MVEPQKVELTMKERLENVLQNIKKAQEKSKYKQNVKLIAVGKTKPSQQIQEMYDLGQRDFGENYVEESINIKQLPPDINWHFIGHLHSNKVEKIIQIPNLSVIQTLDSKKLLDKLQSSALKHNKVVSVYLQIKTSDEDTKYGLDKEESFSMLEDLQKNCPNVKFKGLMTIGKEGDMNAFIYLREIKEEIVKKFKIDPNEIDLSMGMSADYEIAIAEGATNIRVGSYLFGAREYKK